MEIGVVYDVRITHKGYYYKLPHEKRWTKADEEEIAFIQSKSLGVNYDRN